MAKRNKLKFASKARKSSLRIEALEQRQLFATIYGGGGTEVASNITLTNGNTVDQILMTGAAITVAPDAGQVVRVSFLDTTGDIVQAEFAGSGKFTITLEDFRTVGAANYNSPNPVQTIGGATVNYVQGHASIFVDNPEFDTNVSVYSAGLLTLPGLFTGQAKQGGNHYADIARIIIVGDPTNEAGYNNFGGIRAANTIFSGSSGVIGIRAENIAVQNTVIIGDIDASGSGLPTLVFHPLSQFDELRVAGGDLVQSNGSAFNTSTGGLVSFDRFLSVDGARSDFNSAATKQANIDSGAFLLRAAIDQNVLNLAATNQMVQMDGDWNYNLATGVATQTLSGQTYTYTFTGSGQGQLDDMFAQRLFTGNLTVNGALGANLEINLAGVNGTLNMVGDVSGRIEANGLFAKIGKLDIDGNLLGEVFVQGIDRSGGLGRDVFQNTIGSVDITGNVGSTSATGAYIIAEAIGDVAISGNLSGLITTDTNLNGAFNGKVLTGTSYIDYDGSIGNVSIGGNISSGTVAGMTGIGNINVAGNIVGNGAAVAPIAAVFATSAAQNNVATGQSAANLSIGKIGTVTVVGDVDLTANTSVLINIAEEGNFGNVSIQGNGVLGRVDNNDFLNIGAIRIGLGFGNAGNVTGTVTIADAKSTDPRGTDIDFNGVQIGTAGNATGKVGAVTVTGKGEDTDFNLSGILGAFNLGVDIVEVTGLTTNSFEDIVLNGAIQGSKIGAIALNTIAGVGTLDTNDGAGTGVATSVTLNGGIRADDGVPSQGETLGDLTINLGLTNSTITVAAGFQFGATDVLKGTGSSIGNIALTANAIGSNALANIFAETIGNTTLTAGSGAINWVPNYNGLVIGNFTATAASNVTVAGAIGTTGGVNLPAPWLVLPADRTESVGNFSLTTTQDVGTVTFGSTVIADTIGTTTMNGKDGALTFNANFLTAANPPLSSATGAYGAITVASSTKGAIAFNGSLSGDKGGDVTLTTLATGGINITTTFLSGAAGKLTATNADGGIVYNADLQAGSTGLTTLTSSTNGTINYGAASTFAGTVGDVVISTKDANSINGAVTYGGIFGQDQAGAQKAAAAGLVTITTTKGTIGIAPGYDDLMTAAGALTASSTEGAITYNAQSLGGAGAVAAGAGNQIINNPAAETGSIGLVTLSTTGKNTGIAVNADLEATNIAGFNLTTTGTGGAAPINFTGATLFAPTIGSITATTKEGAIGLDGTSIIKAFTNTAGTNMSVAAITFTAATKGAITFNGLVEATSNQKAAANTGTMSIGDLTLTGTQGITVGGQVRVGIYDLQSAANKLDGVVDQGTIGKLLFNGNTTLAATAQFGSEATQTSLQALQNTFLQNGQFALGASLISGFTVNGNLTGNTGGTGVDGLIRAAKLDTFSVTGDVNLVADITSNITGVLGTTTNNVWGTATPLIFVPQLGAVSFGTAGGGTTTLAASTAGTISAPVIGAHDIASLTFNAALTNLTGGNVILALDATSDLDTIGAITGSGRIVGDGTASSFNAGVGIVARGEIEASSIGAVSITATVDGSAFNNAVTGLDLRANNLRGNLTRDADGATAGNQAGTHAITNETINTNGSNIQNFAIGAISITANSVGGFNTNSVFSGLNSFAANGKLGNISIVANLDGTAQPSMFGLATDAAWFTAGDGDSLSTTAASGTDFDGNGLIVGAAELASDYTGGNVSVGNVFVNVNNSQHVLPPFEDFVGIGGDKAQQVDGFAVLAAVQLNTNTTSGLGRGAAAVLELGSRIDAQLFGRMGTVTLRNGQIANESNVVARSVVAALANTSGFGSVIAVAGDGSNATAEIADLVNDLVPLGTVTMTDDPVAANSHVAVVGANEAAPIANQNRWDEHEVLVYVL